MKSLPLLLALSICISLPALSYAQADTAYLNKINQKLPHKFKEIRTGATLEAIREPNAVRIYMIIDDIEQYEEVLVERSDERQVNYSQCKEITVEKGKYKDNYVELVDRYPNSSKMSVLYRIKTITADGILRMYPPVQITMPDAVPVKK